MPLRILIIIIALLTAPSSQAQIYGDFLTSKDENPDAVIIFGSVKDSAGHAIRGASVILSNTNLDYIALSNSQGRFHFKLPLTTEHAELSARCSHPRHGVGIIKRWLPRRGANSPVELQCTVPSNTAS